MPTETMPDKIRSNNITRAVMVKSAVKYVKWEESRETALTRDNRRCKICDTKHNLHVHHLIPRHLGGTDEAANLITLCASCHAVHHPTLQVSLSRSFIERWALKLARMLDSLNEIPDDMEKVKVALMLLGKDHFREGQLEVVLAALRHKSILVVRPTGSGKSLCYQVPALMSSGTSYVFSPLKALMVDQSIGLHQNMIPATFINSDLTLNEKQARYELLEKKALKFLFLTPERFDPDKVKNTDEISKLTQIHPSYLVVDEAHCVDRWGNDFRPSYGRLAEVRNQLGNPPVLAFTATAGVKAQKRILKSMGIPNAQVFVSDVDRPNIALIRHEPKSTGERYRIIKKLIGNNYGKAMIFVPTIKIGQEVSRSLLDMGITIPFYYGQMNAIDREFMLGQFTGRIAPEINNIICTNAFGMGMDIPNVHLVIHWMQPESVEDYLQELGRAGRDGKRSIALIFKSRNDTDLRLYMAKMTAQETTKKGLDAKASLLSKTENINELDRMILDRRRCFRKQIIKYFKEDKIRKGRSIAMMIIEWLLCTKSKIDSSVICCDVCNSREVKRLLGKQSISINKNNKEDRMKFKKGNRLKWKWRPKRWWIGLIVFWVLCTFVGTLVFGIVPKSNDQYIYIKLITFLVVIYAAITDREYSIPMRILWVIMIGIAYEIMSSLMEVFVDARFNIFVAFFVVIAAMRQSRFFVEPKSEIKDEQQNKEGKTVSQDNLVAATSKTTKIKPQSAEDYRERGVAYNDLGDYNQAIKDFNKAIELDPQNAGGYCLRGFTFVMLSNNNQAIKDYNKAIELDPQNAGQYFLRGVAYKNLGDYNQAIKDYNKTIALDPRHAFAYHFRGELYGLIDNYNQAVNDFNKAIELNTQNAETYYLRGLAYGVLGSKDESYRDIKYAARLDVKKAQEYLRKDGIAW